MARTTRTVEAPAEPQAAVEAPAVEAPAEPVSPPAVDFEAHVASVVGGYTVTTA